MQADTRGLPPPRDTFAHLPEIFWQDLKSTCFVCNVGRFQSDQDGIGFDKHVKFEHDPRMYLFFLIYLRRKSVESMVRICRNFGYYTQQREGGRERETPGNARTCIMQHHFAYRCLLKVDHLSCRRSRKGTFVTACGQATSAPSTGCLASRHSPWKSVNSTRNKTPARQRGRGGRPLPGFCR